MMCATSLSDSLLVSAGPSRRAARGVLLEPQLAADGSQHHVLSSLDLRQTAGGSHPAKRPGRVLPSQQQGRVISLKLPAVLCFAEQSARSSSGSATAGCPGAAPQGSHESSARVMCRAWHPAA